VKALIVITLLASVIGCGFGGALLLSRSASDPTHPETFNEGIKP
jgi:predicted small lipoprotein YifL